MSLLKSQGKAAIPEGWKAEFDDFVEHKLKEFQRATVDRAVEILDQNKRVLIADEVGLGKTLVAKGVMARLIEKGARTILYVCSNGDIAWQNLDSLKRGFTCLTNGSGESTRLTLLYHKMLVDEIQASKSDGEPAVRLFALTPGTSFNLSSAQGTRRERALIYDLLVLGNFFEVGRNEWEKFEAQLRMLLFYPGSKKASQLPPTDWNYLSETSKKAHEAGEKAPRELGEGAYDNYLREIKGKLEEVVARRENRFCYDEIRGFLTGDGIDFGDLYTDKSDSLRKDARKIIVSLREAFAAATIASIPSDLIIMDEFQRFSYLLPMRDEQANDLPSVLMGSLLGGTEGNDRTPLVMLSATPFKFYATDFETAAGNLSGGSHGEFLNMIKTLTADPKQNGVFKKKWDAFGDWLNAYTRSQTKEARQACVEARKEAEAEEYRYVVRTERLSTSELIELTKRAETDDHDGCAEPPDSNDGVRSSSADSDDGTVFPTAAELVATRACARLYRDNGIPQTRWIPEYAESCPYLLSFMDESYSKKKELGAAFERRESVEASWRNISLHSLLWLPEESVENYDLDFMDLFKTMETSRSERAHGRLCALLDDIFGSGIRVEQMLWVPPTAPYYKPPVESVYGKAFGKNFSKTIVFSRWQMVPKALSCLLSYECEMRNVATIGKEHFNPGKGSTRYKTFGTRKGSLVFTAIKDGKSRTTPIPLTFPAFGLARRVGVDWNGITFDGEPLGESGSLDGIIDSLTDRIERALNEIDPGFLESYCSEKSKGSLESERFILADLLLDAGDSSAVCTDVIEELIRSIKEHNDEESEADYEEREADVESLLASEEVGEEAKKDSIRHAVAHLEDIEQKIRLYAASRKPGAGEGETRCIPSSNDGGRNKKSLCRLLALAAIGSPAVCMLRAMGMPESRCAQKDEKVIGRVFEFGYAFVKYVNAPARYQAMRAGLETAGWYEEGKSVRNALNYCCIGNFQAMLDEYTHMIRGGQNAEDAKIVDRLMGRYSSSTIPILHNASTAYTADYYPENKVKKARRLRSHFATSFAKSDKKEERADRRATVRNAFNSPFWPFVFTTTSIGQEGLDFHSYCRRIVHWNLPNSPVDLEQREGRINRYECLAVRQTLYARYWDEACRNTNGKYDPWDSLMDYASEHEEQKDSGLLPHWGVGKGGGDIVHIDRITYNYPMSRYAMRYRGLLDSRVKYRLVMGQPNQEELLDKLEKSERNYADQNKADRLSDEDLAKSDLYINLCPFMHKQ